MAKEFKLPDIGEGVAEGEITRWMVEEGQSIKENDLLVEVMTDKVTVEIPSPFTGTVLKRMYPVGAKVNVGSVLIVIGEAGEAPTSPPVVTTAATPQAPAREFKPQAAVGESDDILAPPAVRKRARELGIDLALVKGSGARGRISREDVEGYAKRAPSPTEIVEHRPAGDASASNLPREERVPIRGLRRKIFEHMARSVHTAAHFTYVEETDVTNLVDLREKAKGHAAEEGVKITYLPFILKALLPALKKFPSFNATMDEEKEELVLKRYYNLGIATNTKEGLIVPVVKDVDRKSIFELAREIEELAEKARTGKLTLPEIQGGTFTVTSPGKLGGLLATPIINYPEVAILGVHKIAKRPVVIEDAVEIRHMMNVALSFDHRIIDGYQGAEFTQVLVRYLEHPALLSLV